MKLAVTLLLVCVSVMVCTARAAPAPQTVEDVSSTGTGIGEGAYSGSNTYEDQSGRQSSGYGAAKKGIATAQSSSYYGDYKIPEEVRRAIRARIEARYGPLRLSQDSAQTPTNEATNTPTNEATNTPTNEATNTPTNEATNTPSNNPSSA